MLPRLVPSFWTEMILRLLNQSAGITGMSRNAWPIGKVLKAIKNDGPGREDCVCKDSQGVDGAHEGSAGREDESRKAGRTGS